MITLPRSVEIIILALMTGGICTVIALPFGFLALYAVEGYTVWVGASQSMLGPISEGASAAVVHSTILIFVTIFAGTVIGLRRKDLGSQSVT